jgi:hypothetical protein
MAEREPQPPAEITFRTGYAGMVEAMRARAQERRIAITSTDVAQTAGLAGHYIAKLLSPSKNPVRRVGMISLGPLLGLQAKLLLVPDPEAEKLYGRRIPQRQENCVHHTGAVHVAFPRKFLRKIGAKGGANSRKNLGKRLRRRLARKAANARWAKARGEGL